MNDLFHHISYFLQINVLSLFWVFRLERRRMFALRVTLSAVLSAGIMLLVSFLTSPLSSSNWFLFSLPYMTMLVSLGASYFVCFDISVPRALLLILLPTTAQLCGSAIGTFSSYWIELPEGMFYIRDIVVTVMMCFVSLALTSIFDDVAFRDGRIYAIVLASCYFVVLCIFVLNGFGPGITDDFARYVLIPGYRFLMSVFVFFLVFSMLGLTNMLYRKNIAERLLAEEGKQYEFKRELIELVNIRYHDIKHMRGGQAGGADVDAYGTMIDCGNVALDTVLTEKNLICGTNGIDFSVMADGQLLGHMEPSDIYVLFGNALDNAIECLSGLPENERHMKLTVRSVRDLISIRCENTCHTVPRFVGGLPQTTKGRAIDHGFGTKSIAAICEKYGGRLRMTADGELFVLSVLLPSKK